MIIPYSTSLAPGAFESEFKADLARRRGLRRAGPRIAGAAARQTATLQPAAHRQATGSRRVTLTFIPYYAWANREPQAMGVGPPHEADELTGPSADPCGASAPVRAPARSSPMTPSRRQFIRQCATVMGGAVVVDARVGQQHGAAGNDALVNWAGNYRIGVR